MCDVALFARAWIEIKSTPARFFNQSVALFARAWIEMLYPSMMSSQSGVALFARAWIEIAEFIKRRSHLFSRPLCEGVD